MLSAERGVLLCAHCGQEFFYRPVRNDRPGHATTVCLLCGERTATGEEPDHERTEPTTPPPPAPAPAAPPSRRLRCLLGVLLLLVCVTAVVRYPRLDPVLRSRQRALAQIERLGGNVQSALPYGTPSDQKLPKYRELVVYINLPHPVSDLRPFVPLREARLLWCKHAHFPDESLRELYEFPWLRDLCFLDSHVTDAGLAIIAEHAPGARLVLESPQITDAGLKVLPRLRPSSLELRRAAITDAGLEEIARVPNISRLALIDTQVTGSGLQYFAGLSFTELSLRGSPVTDAGLSHLPKLSVNTLDLSGTQITDEGVKELTRLSLETLVLEETAVTPDGLHVFRDRHPGLRVYVRSPLFTDADIRRCRAAKIDVEIRPPAASP